MFRLPSRKTRTNEKDEGSKGRTKKKKKGSKNCLKEITTIVTITLKLSVGSSFFFGAFEAQKLKASISFSVKSYSVH